MRWYHTAAALVLAAALAVPAAAETFSDVPEEHWARPYIEKMSEEGIVRGIGGGRFAPEDQVSTAQFAVMLTNAFCGEELEAYDGPQDHWWECYLNVAWEAGLLTDTTAGWSYWAQGSWEPAVVEAPMTRFDMAQAMHNTVLEETLALPTDREREAAMAAIGDFGAIPEDYETAVVAMYALGLLSGVNEAGDFDGSATMTRAHACVVMDGLLNLQAGQEDTESLKQEMYLDAMEDQVFSLVNQIRAASGLEPLAYNADLAAAARAHSADMLERNFFSHTNPDGADLAQRLREEGISFQSAGENIAVGYADPDDVVAGWLNSEGHRENLLGPYREMGVGLAVGGEFGYYWTQCFLS